MGLLFKTVTCQDQTGFLRAWQITLYVDKTVSAAVLPLKYRKYGRRIRRAAPIQDQTPLANTTHQADYLTSEKCPYRANIRTVGMVDGGQCS
jgi:hypothetical protein